MIEKIEHNWRNKFGKNNKRVGDVVESLVVSRLLQSDDRKTNNKTNAR
jgi:hypothetical protein